MVETICIFDSQGKKICYQNSTAPQGRDPQLPPDLSGVPDGTYRIMFYDPARGSRGQQVGEGPVSGGATCFDKLKILVDWLADRHNSQYKAMFDQFHIVLHRAHGPTPS